MPFASLSDDNLLFGRDLKFKVEPIVINFSDLEVCVKEGRGSPGFPARAGAGGLNFEL